MSPHLCRFAAPPTLVFLVVLAACSNGSGGGGNGGGSSSGGGSGSGSGGGTCPIVLPTAQVPFGSMPCNALTSADFAMYTATITQAAVSFGGTGCSYVLSYPHSAGGNVIVGFKPGCQFASDQSSTEHFSALNADGGGNGATDITMYQPQQGIGDAAFSYLNAGEPTVEVEHASLAVTVSGGLCNGQVCLDSPGLPSAIAFAKLIVSRY